MTVEKLIEEVQEMGDPVVMDKLCEVFMTIQSVKQVKGARDAAFMWQVDQYVKQLSSGVITKESSS